MTSTADKAAEAYRERVFEWNRANAKWGRFGTQATTRPVICGVCGLWFDDPMSKADHLRHVHRADVWIIADGSLYEWKRV